MTNSIAEIIVIITYFLHAPKYMIIYSEIHNYINFFPIFITNYQLLL